MRKEQNCGILLINKMENYSLKNLLDSVLITPVANELIVHLDAVCSKYVLNISDKEIDECVKSFVNQTINTSLEKLCESYSGNEEDITTEEDQDEVNSETEEQDEFALANLPQIVNIVMSGYCCQKLCKDKQSVKAVICSLSLMNSVKQHWFNSSRLLFPEMICSLYYRYDSYQEMMLERINKSTKTDLIVPLIFEEDIELEDIKDTDKFNKDLESLAYYASRYQIEESVNNNIVKSDSQQPYSDVYKSICNIIDATSWIYLINDPKSIVDKITSTTEDTHKKAVKDILIEFNDKSTIEHSQPVSQSSILLNLIYKKEFAGCEAFLKQKISVQQFAIALYYELLLETILNRD